MSTPWAPFFLNSNPNSSISFGEVALCMVSRTLPPQCLQFKAQVLPVTDIVGKALVEEQKCFVL
jgi:hypothetical protein